jgi:glycosyltransferase 2 family protein
MTPAKPPLRSKLHSWLGHALRFGFAALVITILIRSGALDPALLGEAIARHPGLYAFAFLIYLIPLQIGAWARWHWFLRAAKVPITWRTSARLHLTGLFFGGFLPGGTGGDLAKGWYLLKGRGRKDAAAALGTMVADRVTGLFGLIGLAAATNLVNMRAWQTSPVLAAQSVFILSVAGGMVLLTAAYLSPWKPRWLPSPSKGVPKEGESRGFLAEFALALGSFRKFPRVFLGAIAISASVHFLLVIVYALCAGALDVSLPFTLHAYVAPTLTLANGLPISPAGLGVGEAAGMVLYKAVGAAHGFAEIPALVHTIGLLVALLCAPAYLLRKK